MPSRKLRESDALDPSEELKALSKPLMSGGAHSKYESTNTVTLRKRIALTDYTNGHIELIVQRFLSAKDTISLARASKYFSHHLLGDPEINAFLSQHFKISFATWYFSQYADLSKPASLRVSALTQAVLPPLDTQTLPHPALCETDIRETIDKVRVGINPVLFTQTRWIAFLALTTPLMLATIFTFPLLLSPTLEGSISDVSCEPLSECRGAICFHTLQSNLTQSLMNWVLENYNLTLINATAKNINLAGLMLLAFHFCDALKENGTCTRSLMTNLDADDTGGIFPYTCDFNFPSVMELGAIGFFIAFALMKMIYSIARIYSECKTLRGYDHFSRLTTFRKSRGYGSIEAPSESSAESRDEAPTDLRM